MNANEIVYLLRADGRMGYFENRNRCIKLDLDAADMIESLQKQLAGARNELCIKCGRYKESYLGACDVCRWKRDY